MTTTDVLTIDRARWRRGGDEGEEFVKFGTTKLLSDYGGKEMMCCLGFDALACGLTKDDIRGAASPKDITAFFPHYNEGEDVPSHLAAYYESRVLVEEQDKTSGAIGDAIDANDHPLALMPDDVRETRVREALKKLGWKDVVFIGKYPK